MIDTIPGLAGLVEYFEEHGVTACVLYGSRALGKTGPRSDIDLAVAADKPLSLEKLNQLYLTAVSFLHCEIDLTDLRKAKGLFLKEILTGGEILIDKDPEFIAGKAIEMMDYQTDLAPQINAMLRERVERSVYGK